MTRRNALAHPKVRGPLLLFVGVLVAFALSAASASSGRHAQNRDQIAGCGLGAQRSIASARKAASDSIREDELAGDPRESAVNAHRTSAVAAAELADTLLTLAGVRTPAPDGDPDAYYADPARRSAFVRGVLDVRYHDPAVRRATDRFCRDVYPPPDFITF